MNAHKYYHRETWGYLYSNVCCQLHQLSPSNVIHRPFHFNEYLHFYSGAVHPVKQQLLIRSLHSEDSSTALLHYQSHQVCISVFRHIHQFPQRLFTLECPSIYILFTSIQGVFVLLLRKAKPKKLFQLSQHQCHASSQ